MIFEQDRHWAGAYADNFNVLRPADIHVLHGYQHNSPHIHVSFQDFEAVFSIPQGELLAGSFPKNKRRLVEAWVEIHADALMADWSLAVQGKELFKIEPLK